MLGLGLFALVYLGIASDPGQILFFDLFFLCGCRSKRRYLQGVDQQYYRQKGAATDIGTYTGFQSICTMIASSLTGFVCYQFGADTAFIATFIMTVLVIIYFLDIDPKPVVSNDDEYGHHK